MRELLLFHPSSVGRLMTEPKTLKEGPLSVGAKTYVRELVAQEIFGVEFEVSSKEMDKGNQCEQASIDLFNLVTGRTETGHPLIKNTERLVNEYLTGEPDLQDVHDVRDNKTAWSIASFPIVWEDVNSGQRQLYEWQLRAYMLLANKPRAGIAYTIVTTPDELIPRYEPQSLHFVEHVPPHLRLTRWQIERDAAKETALIEKIKAARLYYREVVAEFDRTHRQIGAVTIDAPAQPAPKPIAPAEIPASIF